MKKSKLVTVICIFIMMVFSLPSYAEVIDIDSILNELGYEYSAEGVNNPTFIDGLRSAVKVYGLRESDLSNISDSIDIKGIDLKDIKVFNYALDKGILKGIDFLDEEYNLKKNLTSKDYLSMIINATNISETEIDYNNVESIALNLKLYQIEEYDSILDDNFTIGEMKGITYNALTRTYGLEKIPYWKKLFIEGRFEYDQAKKVFDPYLKPLDEIDESLITIGSHEFDYADISVEDGMLIIKGIHNDPKYTRLGLRVNNNGSLYKEQTISKYSGSKFYHKFDISNLNGIITVDIFCGELRFGSYYVWASNIELKKEDGVFKFDKPLVFEENRNRFLLMKTNISEDKYIGSNEQIDMTNSDIIKLSDKIASSKSTKMSEVRAIYSWVVQNMYYDLNQLETSAHEPIDTTYVLKEKRTTCGGFANLTAALMRARGIPAVVVYGYSLDYAEDKEWDEANSQLEVPNHAWLEVFVDGKWIQLDPTWDCINFYKDGEYTKSQKSGYSYFDPSMQYFSITHKIIEYRDSAE